MSKSTGRPRGREARAEQGRTETPASADEPAAETAPSLVEAAQAAAEEPAAAVAPPAEAAPQPEAPEPEAPKPEAPPPAAEEPQKPKFPTAFWCTAGKQSIPRVDAEGHRLVGDSFWDPKKNAMMTVEPPEFLQARDHVMLAADELELQAIVTHPIFGREIITFDEHRARLRAGLEQQIASLGGPAVDPTRPQVVRGVQTSLTMDRGHMGNEAIGHVVPDNTPDGGTIATLEALSPGSTVPPEVLAAQQAARARHGG